MWMVLVRQPSCVALFQTMPRAPSTLCLHHLLRPLSPLIFNLPNGLLGQLQWEGSYQTIYPRVRLGSVVWLSILEEKEIVR